MDKPTEWKFEILTHELDGKTVYSAWLNDYMIAGISPYETQAIPQRLMIGKTTMDDLAHALFECKECGQIVPQK
jgi:hypothetical protein